MTHTITLKGAPVVGFGNAEVVAPVASASSPWPMVVATSVVSAATSWIVEEALRSSRKKRRR